MMSVIVAAEADLRRSEKAMPTCEKSRSTVAELAGQPRYWRAITERLGNFAAFSFHQSTRARPTPSCTQSGAARTVTDSGTYWFTLSLAPALLLVLDQILNVKLIVVDRAYCCLLLVLNSNNNNFC